MSETALRLQKEIDLLPVADRAALASYLLETLDDGVGAAEAEAWEAELDRRYAEIVAGTAKGRPLDEARAEWRKEFP